MLYFTAIQVNVVNVSCKSSSEEASQTHVTRLLPSLQWPSSDTNTSPAHKAILYVPLRSMLHQNRFFRPGLILRIVNNALLLLWIVYVCVCLCVCICVWINTCVCLGIFLWLNVCLLHYTCTQTIINMSVFFNSYFPITISYMFQSGFWTGIFLPFLLSFTDTLTLTCMYTRVHFRLASFLLRLLQTWLLCTSLSVPPSCQHVSQYTPWHKNQPIRIQKLAFCDV